MRRVEVVVGVLLLLSFFLGYYMGTLQAEDRIKVERFQKERLLEELKSTRDTLSVLESSLLEAQETLYSVLEAIKLLDGSRVSAESNTLRVSYPVVSLVPPSFCLDVIIHNKTDERRRVNVVLRGNGIEDVVESYDIAPNANRTVGVCSRLNRKFSDFVIEVGDVEGKGVLLLETG